MEIDSIDDKWDRSSYERIEVKCAECKDRVVKEAEFGVHNEEELVKEIIKDALKLEKRLRLYMTRSTLGTVQDDMGQVVGQNEMI